MSHELDDHYVLLRVEENDPKYYYAFKVESKRGKFGPTDNYFSSAPIPIDKKLYLAERVDPSLSWAVSLPGSENIMMAEFVLRSQL